MTVAINVENTGAASNAFDGLLRCLQTGLKSGEVCATQSLSAQLAIKVTVPVGSRRHLKQSSAVCERGQGTRVTCNDKRYNLGSHKTKHL